MRSNGLKAQLGQALIDGNMTQYDELVEEAEGKGWTNIDAVAQRAVAQLKSPTRASTKSRKNPTGRKQRAVATTKAPRKNAWDDKPGTTDREALAAFTEGKPCTATIGDATVECLVGELYTNKGGTERIPIYIDGSGFGTVRAHGGKLPEATTVRLSPKRDRKGGASVQVVFGV